MLGVHDIDEHHTEGSAHVVGGQEGGRRLDGSVQHHAHLGERTPVEHGRTVAGAVVDGGDSLRYLLQGRL